MERYDLVVIGCGPAGEKGAVQAAYFGRKVLVAEKEPSPGGAMVHTGTLASKSLRESALVISGMRQQGFGVETGLGRLPTIEELGYRRVQVAHAEADRMRRNLAAHGVEYVRAQASFVDAHHVRLWSPNAERIVCADHVLVASGSRPVRPSRFPFERPEICDSDEVVTLARLPRSIAVVGAGVIGSEYASIFAALGIEVHLLDGRDRLLPFLDEEVGRRLHEELTRIGVKQHFSTGVSSCTVEGDWDVSLGLDDGRTLRVECVLVAAGRQSNVESLALDKAGGVTGSRGLVTVNERMQTSVPHIYAAGDVIGFPALASTSMEQARVAMCHAFELGYKTRMGTLLPYAIYTIPECSYIGLSEQAAADDGLDYVVGRSQFADNARGQIMCETGFLKLVVDATDKRILGAHIVCERASELIHVVQAHMSHGATIEHVIEQVFNYPTLGEAFKYAAYDAMGRLAERAGGRR